MKGDSVTIYLYNERFGDWIAGIWGRIGWNAADVREVEFYSDT